MAETSGTLTASAVTIAANPARLEIVFSNNSDTVMTARYGGSAASAAAGISIPAGVAIRLEGPIWAGAWSLFCAGTAKAYTIYEW